jgi:hypothetical protein
MEKNFTPLVDEHLQSLKGMQEADAGDFFYTRLMARMENNRPDKSWSFPLKPVWVIGTLVALLAINGFMLVQDNRPGKKNVYSSPVSSIQDFASSYDQSISSY